MKTATLILISWLVTTLLSQAQEPHFQWANCIGGISGDHTDAITVDDTGNVYTTGIFCGTVDFDPNAGILNLISVFSLAASTTRSEFAAALARSV